MSILEILISHYHPFSFAVRSMVSLSAPIDEATQKLSELRHETPPYPLQTCSASSQDLTQKKTTPKLFSSAQKPGVSAPNQHGFGQSINCPVKDSAPTHPVLSSPGTGNGKHLE